MKLSFEYAPERQYYAIRFQAGTYESVPFVRELRFWGVSRAPSRRLSALAALLALRNHSMIAVTLNEVTMDPPVCTALSQYFGVEIYPATVDVDRRDLAGGERIVAPARANPLTRKQKLMAGSEELTWISLDDMSGPLRGQIRSNLDAFDLSESEKNLIVALCCAGKDVGHIVLEEKDPAIADILHRIGLELVSPQKASRSTKT